MCNADRAFNKTVEEREEDDRAKRFIKIFDTLRNFEQDYPLLISSGNDRQSRIQ